MPCRLVGRWFIEAVPGKFRGTLLHNATGLGGGRRGKWVERVELVARTRLSRGGGCPTDTWTTGLFACEELVIGGGPENGLQRLSLLLARMQVAFEVLEGVDASPLHLLLLRLLLLLLSDEELIGRQYLLLHRTSRLLV